VSVGFEVVRVLAAPLDLVVMAAAFTELWSRLLLPSDAPAARAAFEAAEAVRRQAA
jgi:hypothetical protein